MNPHVLRRWWPLAAVATLLAVASLAAAYSAPQLTRVQPAQRQVEEPTRPPGETPPDRSPPPVVDGAFEPPSWLSTALLGLCAALVVAAVLSGLAIAARDRRRRRATVERAGAAPRPRPNAAEVVAAVEAGLANLDDADADPRRAVIACWVRLEEAAAAAGTPRLASDTSTDLVGRLLADHAVSADVLAGFAAVYRQARYATRTVDDEMRAQARAALRRLRGELTAPAAAPGAVTYQ
jgi:Domain of unknown function (DUF4129)